MSASPPHRWRFAAFGTTFGLGGNDEVALDHASLRVRWLGWSQTACGHVDVDYELTKSAPDVRATAPAMYGLRCNGLLVHVSADLYALLDAFEDHAKLLTACRAEGRLFVHAGAVSWGDIGIVIPGRSRSGKTTLVRALVEAGAVYYSDEFAVLDAEGRMHPYALPLSIRAGDMPHGGRIPVETVGGRTGTQPVHVGFIAVTHYRRWARWRPRALSAGTALLTLMDNTVAARRAPQTAMAVLRQTVLGTRAIHSARGDARRVAAALLAEVG
jgi:hypothetical protein